MGSDTDDRKGRDIACPALLSSPGSSGLTGHTLSARVLERTMRAETAWRWSTEEFQQLLGGASCAKQTVLSLGKASCKPVGVPGLREKGERKRNTSES